MWTFLPILLFTSSIYAAKEVVKEKPSTSSEMLVEVEPLNLIIADIGGEPAMVPYRLRRNKWGYGFAVGYNIYEPEDYESQTGNELFSEIYSAGGFTEIQILVKRNLSFGSVGGEMNISSFSVKADSGSKLSVTMAKLGLKVALDTLFQEPYFVPYIGGGVYVSKYTESIDSTSFTGTTGISSYAKGGALIQLDWLDGSAARNAYAEAGIENTFLYIEAQMLMASTEEADPDFSALSYGGGLQVEF